MAASKPEPIRRGFTFAHGVESLLRAHMTAARELLSTVGARRPLVGKRHTTLNYVKQSICVLIMTIRDDSYDTKVF